MPLLDDVYITAIDLAKRLSVSRKTIYVWSRNGLLPMPRKLGTLSRWHWPEVQTALGKLPQRLGRRIEAAHNRTTA